MTKSADPDAPGPILINTEEERRLHRSRERAAHWKRWGPYLSERAWGTVREDYSEEGHAWDYLPHDHARSRAYRWNEDGIAGISDRRQLICFALALWNERDPILKERLYGLTGAEGNHGEDVKELYYYLDSTPTHSYMRYLYKYPQGAYPYETLIRESQNRNRLEPEFELLDTGIFTENRYFDVFVEYAKADVEDILIRIRAHNRGPEPAPLHLLPTLWFRNTWTWHKDEARPLLQLHPLAASKDQIQALQLSLPAHPDLRTRYFYTKGATALLFTENETNNQRLFDSHNETPYVKDAFHRYLVNQETHAVNPAHRGTKAAAHYHKLLAPGETWELQLRLCPEVRTPETAFADFDEIFRRRKHEADEFYKDKDLIPKGLSQDSQNVMRQAFAGLLWSKQFYHYVVRDWLHGDKRTPKPPARRKKGRNHDWGHLYNADVISMPDKWEYPWYAAWDLAFHCLPLALLDADFAKEQLVLLLREWYMHPSGQIPAYEWAFGDVNPPVHAWAAFRVYKIDKARTGVGDRAFLSRIFHKLMLNFTWWVNRKDRNGHNVFEGGFLGLDNIGVFDRSAPLPTGGHLEQSDGTSWMAMYCLNMLGIALELARTDPSYEDVASKFWEHFIHIGHAMNTLGLWNEEDQFYYDVLHLPDGSRHPMKIRSMVGLIPLLAVETMDEELLQRLPSFRRRMDWFLDNRPDLTRGIACMRRKGAQGRHLMSLISVERLPSVLGALLDSAEFLSDYGIRSVSRRHKKNPYRVTVDGVVHEVAYEPAESPSGLFGGNSNWRGPIWFPVNFLLIEALQKFHYYLGDSFTVEMPTGSGQQKTLWEIAKDLSHRLCRIFLIDQAKGIRPVFGPYTQLQQDPHFSDYILFYEYFHGDSGMGLGASHQTGWTALVAKLLQQSGADLL